MGLRKGQRELVEQYRGGKCAVPAIPGGGKTHCLSIWAAEIIEQRLHKPGKILIVTYMNSAVNNFRQRIGKELEKRGLSQGRDYFISTIHGLCLQIIKEKPDLANTDEDFQVVDGGVRNHLLSKAFENWLPSNEQRFIGFIEDDIIENGNEACKKKWKENFLGVLSTAISYFKARGLNSQAITELCTKMDFTKNSLVSCAAEIYVEYDRSLELAGLLDFDDMLYKALNLLETDSHLLELYRKRYSFVCEDEAQDSNMVQSRILELISKGNLLRVGDSNQAICGTFTSSDFRLFKEFCEASDTVSYNITQSSRNTKEIINLANYFVNYVCERHPVKQCRNSLLPQFIETVDPKDTFTNPITTRYGIQTAVLSSWKEEVSAVIGQVANFISKHPNKTISILVPSSWKMDLVVEMLELRKIPYEFLDNTGGDKSIALKKLGRAIDYVSRPENEERRKAFLHQCLGVNEETSQNELLIANMIAEEIKEFAINQIEKLIIFISEKLDFNAEETAISHKVASDYRFMQLSDPTWSLELLAGELMTQRNRFSYFTGLMAELKGYEPTPGAVTVATYHKSKGLEWDVVFLTGLSYSDFPVTLKDKFIGEYWYLKDNFKNPQAVVKSELDTLMEGTKKQNCILEAKLETISEKARLLYVGITRARQYLFLSGCHENEGKRNESFPSEYLLELRKFIDLQRGEFEIGK